MKISVDQVRKALGPRYGGLSMRTEDTVDSTNLRLKEEARSGQIAAPYLLAADYQTAGRGRLGRSFISPPDTGLYLSLLYDAQADSGKITILSAVAVCRAIEELTGEKPKIKWVNDLFLRGRKISGILAEKIDEGVIIGIGVNILTPPGGFPESAGVAGAIGYPVDRALLAGLIGRFLLEGLENPNDPRIIASYRERMPLTGHDIHFEENGQMKHARVTGVADDGGLMIEGAEGSRVLRCGEISLGSQSFSGLE